MRMMKNGEKIDLENAFKFDAKKLPPEQFRWTGDAIAALLETRGMAPALAEALGTYMANLGLYYRDNSVYYVQPAKVQKTIRLMTRDLAEEEARINA